MQHLGWVQIQTALIVFFLHFQNKTDFKSDLWALTDADTNQTEIFSSQSWDSQASVTKEHENSEAHRNQASKPSLCSQKTTSALKTNSHKPISNGTH